MARNREESCTFEAYLLDSGFFFFQSDWPHCPMSTVDFHELLTRNFEQLCMQIYELNHLSYYYPESFQTWSLPQAVSGVRDLV